MRGFVNYYIDEEEENYEVLRGEKDIYKFKLSQTEIELRDPTKEDIPLEFKHDGIIFTDHVTRVDLQSDFSQTKKISYEKELDDLLRTKLGNVAEIEFFDHNIRYYQGQSQYLPGQHIVLLLDLSGRTAVGTPLLTTSMETLLRRPRSRGSSLSWAAREQQTGC